MGVNLKLNDKQRVAFYSPATEVLFGGSAGPGKSLFLRISGIRWCEEVPGIQVYLFRRQFPDLRDNHLRGPTSYHALLADRLMSGVVKYNKQENEFVWVKTGSRIKLCHCQYEDDVFNYQGAEIHVLQMDELTHFTEFQYRFLRGRVRCVGLKIPEKYKEKLPRIECGSNPGNIGHSWVKKAFIRSPFEIYKTEKEEGGLLRQFIPARLQDNPQLLIDDPQYEQRLDGLGSPTLVKAMKEGDWDVFSGQYFEDWRREIHVLPRNTVIEPHWTIFGGYDHGYNHPYVFGVYAVDGDGDVIKFAECGGRGRKPDQIFEDMRAVYPRVTEITIHAGHDCWSPQRDGGPSICEQFYKMNLKLVQANIDRVHGWSQVRSYLDWRKDEAGNIIKRPKFYITENCWRTINQLPALIRNDKKVEDVLKVNATDQDEWCGDDAADETRYALMSRPRLTVKKQEYQKHMAGYFIKRMQAQENHKKRLRQL